MKENKKMEYEYNSNQEYKPADPEYLNKLAADYKNEGRDETSKDIYAASETITKLKVQINSQREEKIKLQSEIDAYKLYQEKLNEVFEPLVANLFNTKMDEFISNKLSPEVDLLIDENDTVSSAINDIEDLRGQIDDFEPSIDNISDVVRDMIRDGDITVSLDIT
jgi:chromosome segregation ATPase